jgi:signal transduction histidine kinase
VRAAPSDLREVAERAVRAMEPIAYRQGQALTLMLPPQPVGAVVDEELLGRALLNLVSNACKYGRQEGGRVDVLLEADGHEGVFTVSDDGPGITEADLERIFQRFYRAPTPEGRRVQGNGLGLPLCRMLVELHGGRVWVDRGPGVGSMFRLAVPLNSLLAHCSSAR